MADLFSTSNMIKLLKNKKIMLIGDSNIRALYKDFVMLLTKNNILDPYMLKIKGEESHMRDTLVNFHGLSRSISYVESRKFQKDNVEVQFTFITRCVSQLVQEYLDGIKNGSIDEPDVLIMNSTLWDISRYPNGIESFKENIVKLMELLKSTLNENTLFIWVTAFPLSPKIGPAILTKNLMNRESYLRFEIMEANNYCRQIIVSHGFNVLDAHFYLRMNLHTREDDGIHYSPSAVRLVTLLLLTHICKPLSWNVELPGKFNSAALERMKRVNVLKITEKSQIPETSGPLLEKCIKDNNEGIKRKVKPSVRIRQNKMISKRGNNRYQPYDKNFNLPKTEEVPPWIKRSSLSDHNHMDASTTKEWEKNQQFADETPPWCIKKSSNVLQQQQSSYKSGKHRDTRKKPY